MATGSKELRKDDAPGAIDIALLLVCISWASTHSIVKRLLSDFTPFGMTALRFLLMMSLAAVILAVTKTKFDKHDWPRLVLVAMLSHGLYQFAYVASIDKAGAFVAGVLLSMVPVFTIVIAVVTRTEKPSRAQIIGILFAAACTIGFILSTHRPDSGSSLGALLSLAAALLFAAYGVLVKPLAQKYSTWSLISAQALIGGIPLVIVGLPDLLRQDWGRVDPVDWGLILVIAFIPAFAAYAAWNWAISHVGAARTSAYALLVPVLATYISLSGLEEPWSITSILLAGGLVVSLAITRIQRTQETRPA